MSGGATRRATTPRRPAARVGGSAGRRDGLIITWRNLKRIPRIPELAIFAMLQSIMFVLLFAFVFGGAIPIPRRQLLPRVPDAGHLRPDDRVRRGDHRHRHRRRHQQGHHRPLPLAADGALGGADRALVVRRRLQPRHPRGADAVRPGRRLGASHTGIPEFLAGVGLLLLFAFAMSWLGIWLGLMVPSVEVAQQVIFTVLFPITFLSNVFVPPQTLPDWLQPIAEWNPTSTLTGSLRQLWGNPNPYATNSFPLGEPGPGHADLGGRRDRRLRAARHPPLPKPEPLTA